jgi:two-component system CheB/CheR fusion protein
MENYICIVDDDGPVRESLRMLLEREGFSVRCFSSSAMFLSQAKPDECECLLLDEVMPGLSGLQLLEILRARHNVPPTIIITGGSDSSLPKRARKAGALAVLHKPLIAAELLGWMKLAATKSVPSSLTH